MDTKWKEMQYELIELKKILKKKNAFISEIKNKFTNSNAEQISMKI